jgi:hypothetical protein
MSTEPTTIRERYSRAMSSSHLELNANRRGDIDVIMAAGAVGMPDERRDERVRTGYSTLPISALLLRLMGEYDEARGPRAISRRNFETDSSRQHARDVAADAVARETARRARKFTAANMRRPEKGEAQMTPDEVRACMVKAGEDLRDQIAHDARMAHAFVLMRLQSLASTKQAFGEWAMSMAIRRRFMDVGPLPVVDPDKSSLVAAWRKGKLAQQTVVMALAGQVLDLLLDPNCYRCEGRGFNGGYSQNPQRLCNDERKGGCSGSGRRPTNKLGNCKEQHEFAAYLMMEVDIMLGRTTREMNQKLRDAPEAMAVT